MITVPYILFPPMNPVAYNLASSFLLDATDEFGGFVFRVPKSGTLRKIGWRTGSITAGTSFTLKISLETVSSSVGQPVATTNADKTLYATGAESADITSLSSNTTYFTAINGTSGISVTAGDLIAVTFRLTAVNGASISIVRNGSSRPGYELTGLMMRDVYAFFYLNSAWMYINTNIGPMALEYSDGFYPVDACTVPPSTLGETSYNSGSLYPYYGLKFRLSYTARLSAIVPYVNLQANANLIVYGSDEYTELANITLDSNKQHAKAYGNHHVTLSSKLTLQANTWYRCILVPITSTSVGVLYADTTSDGSYNEFDAAPEGNNIQVTYRGTAPSSGEHTWTDIETRKLLWSFIFDGIDTGGGFMHHPGMAGGLNG